MIAFVILAKIQNYCNIIKGRDKISPPWFAYHILASTLRLMAISHHVLKIICYH